MNYDKEIEKASHDFDTTVGACYLFLTKNGLKGESVRQFLHDMLDKTCDQVEEKT